MIEQDLFDRAKERVAIEDLAGKVTKLRGNANQQRGVCPVQGCGSNKGKPKVTADGKKKRTTGGDPFAVWPRKGNFRCYSCGAWGDVVDLEHQLEGGTLAEAARRLLGERYAPSAPRKVYTAEQSQADNRKRVETAERLWREAMPILGTLAEKYLKARFIHPAVIVAAAPALRFHPAAIHSYDEDLGAWVKAPALLLRVETEGGFTGGVHATYLLRDGSGRDKALGKKMWGSHIDQAGRRAGAWLIGPVRAGYDGTPLVEAEGLETTLSLASLAWMQGRRVRACAALSLDRLQGLIHRDAEGCMDMDAPRADLAHPPFLWTMPAEQPWPEILVGVDHDMKPWKTMGRTGRGKPVQMVLDAQARAALCGTLVKQQWRAFGQSAVRPLLPPLNKDWNNELQRRVLADKARLGACA